MSDEEKDVIIEERWSREINNVGESLLRPNQRWRGRWRWSTGPGGVPKGCPTFWWETILIHALFNLCHQITLVHGSCGLFISFYKFYSLVKIKSNYYFLSFQIKLI